MAPTPERTPEPLMDILRVATVCDVSEKTVRRWITAVLAP